jgi:hypothetical protein
VIAGIHTLTFVDDVIPTELFTRSMKVYPPARRPDTVAILLLAFDRTAAPTGLVADQLYVNGTFPSTSYDREAFKLTSTVEVGVDGWTINPVFVTMNGAECSPELTFVAMTAVLPT